MTIALLFISLIGGMVSGGMSLYLGFGWAMALAAYVLGGMIGSGVVIGVAIFRTENPDMHAHRVVKPASRVTG